MQKIKTVSFFISLLLFSAAAFSQSGNQHNDFGLYIGPNFSNIDIKSPELSAATRSGYQAGMFYRSGKIIYGQAGLQYQVMKSNFSIIDSTGTSSDELMFRRLQLPLYGGLNLMPILKSVFNLRAYAGPVISYDFDIANSTLEFSPADFNKFRVDGTFGAGVDILIFSLDAGYTMGLNNLFHKNFDGKGNYAFVNLGLRF